MKYMLLVAAAALSAPLPVLAQAVVPVHFAPGTSSRTVTDAIKGYAYKDYRVVLSAGQTLTVSLRGLGGSPYFNVMEPGSGDVAIYNSSMGDQRYSGTTARSGAYTVRVYMMRANARRGETARFALTIAATGGHAAHLPGNNRPGDALVPGTHYHAMAPIPCRSVPGAAMGTCQAGVIRRRGSATVHLDTPDGGERTILFRGQNAVSSDASVPLRAVRRGNVTVVRIGAAEVYEIPDMLIVGG